MIVWSALSLVALLGGIGILFGVYGRWSQQVGWHSAEATNLSFRQPGEVSLTPAQRATVWFFAVVSVLFLAQTLLGAAAEHYRADLSTFFGLDLARILPYNLARTWHLQLALFWTAAAFWPVASSWCRLSPAENPNDRRRWPMCCWARSRWWCSVR